MLQRLKRMIGLNAQELEVVPFSELDIWFSEKIKETPIRTELSAVFDELAVSLKNIHSATLKIQNTTFPDLSADARAVLLQHTKKYVTIVNEFIRKNTYHETRDSSAIINYHDALSESLQKMPTQKESAVIEKFHPVQYQAISESLKSIESLHKQLSEIIKRPHGVQFIADVLNKVHIIERKFQRQEELKAEIEREDIKYSDEFSYKTKLETDLDDFKTSDEYVRFDHLLGKKIKLEKALERESDAGRRIALNELFSDVQRQISSDMASRRAEDLKYKLSHVNAQVKLIEERKARFEQELKELQIEKDLLNVEKTISSLHPVKIQ